MFLDFLPIKFSHLGTVNFNEKTEWSFTDMICWQGHSQTWKGLISFFPLISSSIVKKIREKKLSGKRNKTALQKML